MIEGLTVKQAAEYLDRGKSTAYKRIPEARVPFHKALTGYCFGAPGPSESGTKTR